MRYYLHSSKRSKKKKFRVGMILLGSIFLLGGFLMIIYFSPIFTFRKIKVSGQQDVSVTAIKSFVKENFSYQKSHSLFLSLQPLKKNILHRFPEIQTMVIHRQLPHTLLISLTERKPFLEARFNNLGFLIDQNGFAFKQIQLNHLDISQLEINTNNFQKPEVGQFFISHVLWGKIQPILEHFWKEKEAFHFQEAQLVSSKRLNVVLSPGPEIYFNLEQDRPSSLLELEALRQQKDFFDLKYIDLRFSKRAFIQ